MEADPGVFSLWLAGAALASPEAFPLQNLTHQHPPLFSPSDYRAVYCLISVAKGKAAKGKEINGKREKKNERANSTGKDSWKK